VSAGRPVAASDDPTGEETALDALDLARVDPGGMLARVVSAGEQWQAALDTAPSIPSLGLDADGVRRVVVAGMGGSWIAGDVAAVAARETGGVPVRVVKGYELPADVDEHTLVALVSHSGATAETLACYAQAGDAGAPRLVVSSGGELLAAARDDGVPVALVPQEGPPRAELAHLATALLLALDRSDLLPRGTVAEQLTLVADHLRPLAERWGPEVRTPDNPVKRLAVAIGGRVPVFYGACGWPAVAALRGKCQVNENSERPAFWAEVPELDHNEIVGWGAPPALTEGFAVIALRSPLDEHPATRSAFAATSELLAGRVGTYREVEVEGPAPLARFAALVLHVDLLSVYLAFLAGVDPTPTALIEAAKQRRLGD
jgi:glucose/mannose-6-phosphate isomerase